MADSVRLRPTCAKMASKRFRNPPPSVLGRPVKAIDDERVRHDARRFEFQPELFLNRRKDRWWGVSRRRGVRPAEGGHNRKVHRDAVGTRQARLVHDLTACEQAKWPCQV